MSRTKKILLSIIILFAISAIALLSIINGIMAYPEEAYADVGNILSVSQKSEIFYCGKDYYKNEDAKKMLFSALSFKINDVEIAPKHENITINPKTEGEACAPGDYFCDIEYLDGEQTITANNVGFRISKKTIDVVVYLNGKTDLTINESESQDLTIAYDYCTDIEEDYVEENVFDLTVRKLKDDCLYSCAFVERIPSDPVSKSIVVAGKAYSPLYDFSYPKSFLTIIKDSIPKIEYFSDKEVMASLTGNFSTVNELSFKEISINKSNAEYVAIEEEVSKKYSDSGSFLREHSVESCYKISVTKWDNSVKTDPYTARIKAAKNASEKKEYKIVALYDNGDSDIISASLVEGYWVFDANDSGTFVLYSPVEGIGVFSYFIVIGCGVAVIIFVVLLVALFRKKY